MKKPLFITFMLFTFHSFLFAQKDSAHKPSIAIIFNPGLLIGGHLYCGAEYKPSKDVLFIFGASYGVHSSKQPADTIDNNGLHQGLNPPVVQFGTKGHNYTGYLGAMFAVNDAGNAYFGVSGFYRHWNLFNEVSYSPSPANTDFNDIVIHPQIGNPGEITYYTNHVYVYNVTSNVYCFDITFIADNKHAKNHFLFQVYTGAGFRMKEFLITPIGYYPEGTNTGKSSQPVSFVPVTGQREMAGSAAYFDFKLGVLIGYRF